MVAKAKSKARNKEGPYPPSVSIVLRGKELDPQKISEMLGIQPEISFKRGDKRPQSNKRRSHGVWMLSSSGKVRTLELGAHLNWLLKQIRTSKLAEVLKDKTIKAEMSCFWIMPSTHEVLILESRMLKHIALLGMDLQLDIYGTD